VKCFAILLGQLFIKGILRIGVDMLLKQNVGIVGYGAYVPKTRIKRQDIGSSWGLSLPPGERAVCSYDEDSITMAVEASLDAFQAVDKYGITPGNMGGIFSACSPVKSMDGLLNVILAKTIGTPSNAHLFDLGHSHNAGASSWLASIDAINSSRVNYALAVISSGETAAPGSELEPYIGAGATAFIIGKESTLATIEKTYSHAGFLIDYITNGNVIRAYHQNFVEDQGYAAFVSESVTGLLDGTNKSVADFGHVIIQAPNERVLGRIGKRIGCKENQISGQNILQSIGYLGMDSVFMSLARLLPSLSPEEDVLMVSYGSGVSTAFHLKITSKAREEQKWDNLVKDKKYIDYPTYLRYQGLIEKEKELR
jgi:hydroxymethylglutaryl-CoA synthase